MQEIYCKETPEILWVEEEKVDLKREELYT